jgi:hypothetical protein
MKTASGKTMVRKNTERLLTIREWYRKEAMGEGLDV